MLNLRYLLSSLPLLFLLAASAATTPEAAFRHFVDKVKAGDVDAAWECLSAETQRKLEKLVRAHSEASGGEIPDDPKRVVLGHAALVRPIDRIERLREEGARVTIRVVSEEESQEVVLLREGGSWKVELAAP